MNPNLPQSELECLRLISQSADRLGIPIMVVGATARQLVFDLPYRIRPHRLTQDWDFGVRVPAWGIFRQFRTVLLATNAFKPGLPEHRLIYTPTNMAIDLVPFGGVEDDGRIRWPQGDSEMDVIGFSDAYEHCIEIELGDQLRLKIATTPLLVALKLLAFGDRKDNTDRDITDLWHFMNHYVDTVPQARLWEEPIGPNISADFEWEYAGPLLLGWDMACACRPRTVQRLTPLVAELLDPYSRHTQPLVARLSSQEAEELQRQKISKSFRYLRQGIVLAVQLKQPSE